jgi:glucokinase
MKVKVEVAIEDLAGAITAEKVGADRVEVCSELSVGGLTPSIGMVQEILRRTSTIELVIMIRPRAGNFSYSESEIATMAADLDAFNQLDFAGREVGFIYGALDHNNQLDVENLKILMAANKSGRNCFHMAFDSTPNIKESLHTLIDLGFERVLTSGGASSAFAGIEQLNELRALASGKIEIVAGGGIRPHNAREILDLTGVKQLHLRAAEQIRSAGTGKYDAVTLYRTSAVMIEKMKAAVNGQVKKSAYLVIDIGGTSIKGALLTTDFQIIDRTSTRTEKPTLETDLFSLITELSERAKSSNLEVLSIGVITAGAIDEETGTVLFASNLGWRDYPLAANLRSKFNLPVAVGHDVRCATLAEGKIGSVPGISHFISVSIGTGIAIGIVDKGKIVSGSSDSAGESGHMPLVADGAICPCGQRGCWERYASGHGIAERYRELTGLEKRVDEIIPLVPVDSNAEKVWNDAITKTAQALAILVLTIDPEKIVLGGGVAAGFAGVLPELQEQLQGFLAWRKAPEIKISTLGDDGGIYGAGILAATTT